MGKNKLRKRIYLFAACCLAIIVLWLSCARREIKNLDSKGKNIICFGDSISFGYGVLPSQAYPKYLETLLGRKVINAGVDGDTTTEALKRIKEDVLSRDPYLVIIEFGGNDFLRKVPREITFKNLALMVDKVQAQGAIVAVTDISAGLLMREYRCPYKKIALDREAIFVPSIMKGIITNPKMKSDFFHPNEEGYKIIADRVYRAIKPYIKD